MTPLGWNVLAVMMAVLSFFVKDERYTATIIIAYMCMVLSYLVDIRNTLKAKRNG